MYRKLILAFAMTAAAAGICAASEPDATVPPACDRQCLKGMSDLYFAALAKHDPAGLPLARGVKYTENGRALKLGEGLWKTAGASSYRLEIFDPQTGGAAVETVVDENGQPVCVMLRLKVADRKIIEAETVLVRKADGGNVFNPENMNAPPPLYTQELWPSDQDSRLSLMAATDAYFRAMQTEGTPAYAPAPLLPDTRRIANGNLTNNPYSATGPGNTLSHELSGPRPSGAIWYDRRYPLVDVEHGVVLAIVRYKSTLNPPPRTAPPAPGDDPVPRPTAANRLSPLVAYFFAINGGRIREIRAVILRTTTLDSPTGWE